MMSKILIHLQEPIQLMGSKLIYKRFVSAKDFDNDIRSINKSPISWLNR